MREVTYGGAISLDGFLAGPGESIDWLRYSDETSKIIRESFAGVDAMLMGRKTFEFGQRMGGGPPMKGVTTYVFSRTLTPATEQGVTIVRDDPVALARSLRNEAGPGEIWLFGGGELFATLLAAGQVDQVEITVVPVLLGGGVPLVAHLPARSALSLIHTQVYPSGMVALHYKVLAAEGAAQ